MSAPTASRLETAALRLDRALAQLEVRLSQRLATAGAGAGDLFEADRARLAADLDASRAREAELRELAGEAAQALDRAIEQLTEVLGPDAEDLILGGEIDAATLAGPDDADCEAKEASEPWPS